MNTEIQDLAIAAVAAVALPNAFGMAMQSEEMVGLLADRLEKTISGLDEERENRRALDIANVPRAIPSKELSSR